MPNEMQQQMDPQLATKLFMGAASPQSNASPSLTELLSMFEIQHQQLAKVMQMAKMFGQDTSSLHPLAKKLVEGQMAQLQSTIGQSMLPQSATTPQVNVPAPIPPQQIFNGGGAQ